MKFNASIIQEFTILLLCSRSYFQVFAGIENYSSKSPGHMEPELSQQVLESLFNMPTPKSAEREPNSMNWRNIVKKMTSLRQGSYPIDNAPLQCSRGMSAFLIHW